MATNRPVRWKRRTYIVNRAFQWRFAGTVAVIVFLLSSTMSTVLYGALHQQARMRLIHPETYNTEVTLVVLASGLAFAAITSVAVLIWALLVSHRICGPLWLIGGYFRELAEGRLPNLRPLRKKDEFKEFYADFGRAVDSLRASQQSQLAAVTEALCLAESVGDADEDTHRVALESVTRRLHSLRREIAEAVGATNDKMSGGKRHPRSAAGGCGPCRLTPKGGGLHRAKGLLTSFASFFPWLAIPLQLIAYHAALLRGCNVDKPRNLAKSVTVE